jgi:hypothetical protein
MRTIVLITNSKTPLTGWAMSADARIERNPARIARYYKSKRVMIASAQTPLPYSPEVLIGRLTILEEGDDRPRDSAANISCSAGGLPVLADYLIKNAESLKRRGVLLSQDDVPTGSFIL